MWSLVRDVSSVVMWVCKTMASGGRLLSMLGVVTMVMIQVMVPLYSHAGEIPLNNKIIQPNTPPLMLSYRQATQPRNHPEAGSDHPVLRILALRRDFRRFLPSTWFYPEATHGERYGKYGGYVKPVLTEDDTTTTLHFPKILNNKMVNFVESGVVKHICLSVKDNRQHVERINFLNAQIWHYTCKEEWQLRKDEVERVASGMLEHPLPGLRNSKHESMEDYYRLSEKWTTDERVLCSDDDSVVFMSPAKKYRFRRLLVIPRPDRFVYNLVSLNFDHIEMIQRMQRIGERCFREEFKDTVTLEEDDEIYSGFHTAPFNSVAWLHMHVMKLETPRVNYLADSPKDYAVNEVVAALQFEHDHAAEISEAENVYAIEANQKSSA